MIFLLADDDKDDVELFQECLDEIDSSSKCYPAVNGIEALHKLNNEGLVPDMIFLDINMPLMSGWQCLSEIKKNTTFKKIPIIIYSTSSHKREAGIAIDLGAFCFMTKPNSYDELKDILQTIIDHFNSNLEKELGKFKNIVLNNNPVS
jgi:CheY-like chemotaxis protein